MTAPKPITISVVTPSYKQANFLRLCAASVADQKAPGLKVEHIVQDSVSGPEVAEAVRRFPAVQLIVEKDQGMYDAINRGWARATGDVLAWLNCDEQYLPGTLALVADHFRNHPETEILFGDAVVIDERGDYLCSRQVLKPQLYHTWTCHLNTFSCSMFLRRELLERGFKLDGKWKAVGDAVLIRDLLQARTKMVMTGRYLATFVDSGENRSLQPDARGEAREFKAQAPWWMRQFKSLWRISHRIRRWLHGHYHPKPFAYEVYTATSPLQRMHIEVPRPSFYWETRM
jgi:glycosyltransferase involved in cell wall biosynthesis